MHSESLPEKSLLIVAGRGRSYTPSAPTCNRAAPAPLAMCISLPPDSVREDEYFQVGDVFLGACPPLNDHIPCTAVRLPLSPLEARTPPGVERRVGTVKVLGLGRWATGKGVVRASSFALSSPPSGPNMCTVDRCLALQMSYYQTLTRPLNSRIPRIHPPFIEGIRQAWLRSSQRMPDSP